MFFFYILLISYHVYYVKYTYHYPFHPNKIFKIILIWFSITYSYLNHLNYLKQIIVRTRNKSDFVSFSLIEFSSMASKKITKHVLILKFFIRDAINNHSKFQKVKDHATYVENKICRKIGPNLSNLFMLLIPFLVNLNICHSQYVQCNKWVASTITK